ncbi:MAG: ABC transporter substrate-binding protein [Steroidobacteraceae bacterium]
MSDRMLALTTTLLLAVAAPLVPAVAADTAPAAVVPVPGPGPQEIIKDTAERLLKSLDADRDGYRRNPERIRKLVDELMLPHFDSDYAARLVLAKHWRTATPEQRKRFIDAFYQRMLRNYGSALAEFTADRLTVLPFKGDLASGQATVRTEIRRDDGTRVPVNYSVRGTPQGWKAWDVTIEGISYVKNFRTDFGAEIEQKGLEAVIARLEAENQKADAPKGAGASKA